MKVFVFLLLWDQLKPRRLFALNLHSSKANEAESDACIGH